MEVKYVLICVFLSCVKGQDLLSLEPDEFIEGEPGNVTCTYNNQYTTFSIFKSIDNSQSITTCRVSLTSCELSTVVTDYTQYYSLSKTNNSVTIHIDTVNRTRDSGVWRCNAFVSTGNQPEETRTIDVKVPVSSVEITNKDEDLIEDRTVNLECKTVGGYPLPNITWSIDSRLLVTSLNTASSSLPYKPLVSDQGQRLQCSATNGYGQSQTDSIQLDIKYKPVVDIKPSVTPYKLIQGQIVELQCQVNQSNPVVTSYKWYRDGNIITGSSSRYTVSNDDGGYSCSATNSVGESDRSSVISVEILYPPTVSTLQSTYSIIESNTLTLPCIATSNPVPNSYTWTGPNNFKQSQQNLTIPSINRTQTGQYTCTVTNSMIPTTGAQQTGTDNSSTTVNVLYGPEVSVSSGNTDIKENDNLRINCTVKSYPPTNDIVWYQANGDKVPEQFMVNSGANRRDLVINDINRIQSDNYTCTARLDLHPTVGDSLTQTYSQSSIINVQYIPHNIGLINKTSDTICIEWTPGFNGGSTQSFIVQHSADDKTWVNSSRIPDSTNNGRVEYCIEGLEPDTSYYIRVIASNKYGDSQFGFYTKNGEKKTQTSARADNNGCNVCDVCDDRFGAGVGTGFGIALIIVVAVVVIGLFLYKYRQGKGKKPDQMYDSVTARAPAYVPTYQELSPVRNTETPQSTDVADYINLRSDQTRTVRDDTRPYYENL